MSANITHAKRRIRKKTYRKRVAEVVITSTIIRRAVAFSYPIGSSRRAGPATHNPLTSISADDVACPRTACTNERLSLLISTFDPSLPRIITYDLRLPRLQFKESIRHRTDNYLFGCGTTSAPINASVSVVSNILISLIIQMYLITQ